MAFTFEKLDIPGVVLIEPVVFDDHRGFFMETYKENDFTSAGITERFVQENHSRSVQGTLRGLHYQLEPYGQGKLIRVIRGEIWDVAADLRRGSPCYGQWIDLVLSEQNRKMLYVPPGFAHGFCVISETAEIIYKCTREYAPVHERGIMWNDPDLSIDWPMEDPVLSERDKNWPMAKQAENNFIYGK